MEHRHNKIFTAATAIGASISILLIVAYIASAFGGMVDPAESAKLSVLGLCFPILLIAMLIMLLLLLQKSLIRLQKLLRFVFHCIHTIQNGGEWGSS